MRIAIPAIAACPAAVIATAAPAHADDHRHLNYLQAGAGTVPPSNLSELAVGRCGAGVRYAVRFRRRVGRGTCAAGGRQMIKAR
jgi:hypothetical protein